MADEDGGTVEISLQRFVLLFSPIDERTIRYKAGEVWSHNSKTIVIASPPFGPQRTMIVYGYDESKPPSTLKEVHDLKLKPEFLREDALVPASSRMIFSSVRLRERQLPRATEYWKPQGFDSGLLVVRKTTTYIHTPVN